MIQPFGYIINKRVNDLKKCISNEPGMGLGKEKKGKTVRQENAQVNISFSQYSSYYPNSRPSALDYCSIAFQKNT